MARTYGRRYSDRFEMEFERRMAERKKHRLPADIAEQWDHGTWTGEERRSGGDRRGLLEYFKLFVLGFLIGVLSTLTITALG